MDATIQTALAAGLKAMHAETHKIAAKQVVAAVLQEVAEYLDNRSDVVDGDYGVPAPNTEMSLLEEVERAIRLMETL